MPEKIIYSDPNIQITTTRIATGSTTYALRNVTSVRMAMTPASLGCAIFMAVLTAMAILGTVLAFSTQPSKEALLFGLIALGLFIGTIFTFKSAKHDYHVEIHSSSGEARALTSKDKDYINTVVQAINQAIVEYQ